MKTMLSRLVSIMLIAASIACASLAHDAWGASSYYPLAVGNEWEHEGINLKKEDHPARRITILIVHEQIIDNTMTQYFRQGMKPSFIRSGDKIVTPSGKILLEQPLTKGHQWISGNENHDQRLFEVTDTELSITVRGTRYEDCVQITETSMPLNIMSGDTFKNIVFRNLAYYAPDIGLVLKEFFEIEEDGTENKTGKTELVHFKTNQPVPALETETAEGSHLIQRRESFRFPRKGFAHPRLSPDDRWVVYQTHEEIWEALYYSRANKHDKKEVPLLPRQHTEPIRILGSRYSWSPDGKTLAVPFEDNSYDGWLALIDFSGSKPKPIETFTDFSRDVPVFWLSERSFLYLDSFGNIMKKEVNSPPERIVFFRSHYSKRDYITHFQAASNGTIVYATRNGIFATTLDNPAEAKTLYKKPSRTKANRRAAASELHQKAHNPFGLKHNSRFDLSPNGRYALFRVKPPEGNSRDFYAVVDLADMQVVSNFKRPLYKTPRWSPDGDKLAYLQIPEYDPQEGKRLNPHFFIFNAANGSTKNFGLGVSRDFFWTPDARHIIYSMKYAHEFHSSYTNGIFIIRTSDGHEIGTLSRVSAHMTLYLSESLHYVVWKGLNLDTFFVVKNPFRDQMLEPDKPASGTAKIKRAMP